MDEVIETTNEAAEDVNAFYSISAGSHSESDHAFAIEIVHCTDTFSFLEES